jgi:hypothetical protein
VADKLLVKKNGANAGNEVQVGVGLPSESQCRIVQDGESKIRSPRTDLAPPGASPRNRTGSALPPIGCPSDLLLYQMLISLECHVVASRQLPNCPRAISNRRAGIGITPRSCLPNKFFEDTMNKQELPRENAMQAIGTQDDDLERHRERMRNMTDKQLLEYGRACRYMCTPEANLGKPPQESSVIHLREARAEWERRHPKRKAD